jgi:hypothetical protein
MARCPGVLRGEVGKESDGFSCLGCTFLPLVPSRERPWKLGPTPITARVRCWQLSHVPGTRFHLSRESDRANTVFLQPTCRKRRGKGSRCARTRSAATRARRARLSSVLRDRSVRLCPWGWVLPPSPALRTVAVPPMSPAGPASRGSSPRGPERGHNARGRTRRPIWSRDGTRRRSHSCRATLGMACPCPISPRFLPSSEKHHQAETAGRLGLRMDAVSSRTGNSWRTII